MGRSEHRTQYWIYTNSPRKAFANRALKKSTNLFNKKPRTDSSSKSKALFKVGLFLLLLCTGLFLGKLIINNYVTHAEANIRQLRRTEKLNDERAFEFLYNAGVNQFKNNHLKEALYEFKLALAIKPNDENVKQMLEEVRFHLCFEDEKYCSELVELSED